MDEQELTQRLELIEGRFAICRLDPGSEIPQWAKSGPFYSVTRASDELSVICAELAIPSALPCERGFRALKVEGPLDFGAIGILAALAAPLAQAGISILAISTYQTDYLLVRESQLEQSIMALTGRGHRISR